MSNLAQLVQVQPLSSLMQTICSTQQGSSNSQPLPLWMIIVSPDGVAVERQNQLL